MQKVITISTYPAGAGDYKNGQEFIDHPELNQLLSEGFVIQTQFLSNPPGEVKMSCITFILTKR